MEGTPKSVPHNHALGKLTSRTIIEWARWHTKVNRITIRTWADAQQYLIQPETMAQAN